MGARSILRTIRLQFSREIIQSFLAFHAGQVYGVPNDAISSAFLYLASTPNPCLPSPPPSEPGLEGHKLWRVGNKVITDPARAVNLWQQGHDVIPLEIDTEGSNEERGRSLSPVQWPCVGAIDSHEESRGGVNESKKQRLG